MKRILLGILLLWAMPVLGATYFVDVTAGSDSNNGLAETPGGGNGPWAHVPGSVGVATGSGWPATLNNGDSVIVKGGTSNTNIWIQTSGTVGDAPNFYNGSAAFASILIQSGDQFTPQWGTTPAIVDAGGVALYGFFMNSAQGVKIDGFIIRNIADGLINNPAVSQGSAGVGISGVTDCWVDRCSISNCAGHADDHGHGIEGGQLTSGIIVSRCHIGPNIGSKSLETFRFTNGAITNNFFDGTGYQGDHQCVIASLCTNLDVANNVIMMGTNGGTAGSIWSGSGGVQGNGNYAGLNVTSCSFCDVWNNMVFAPYATNLPLRGWSAFYAYEYDDHNRIVHNTFALGGDLANDGAGSLFVLAKQSGVGNFNSIIQNNLFYKGRDNGTINSQWCIPLANQCFNENVQFNDYWGGGSTTENVMAYRPSGTGSDILSTVAAYNPPTSGHTYANNLQVDPIIVGGVQPNGLDANYHPNTTFFNLTPSSPASVKTTGNTITGDATHGWVKNAAKTALLALDIFGTTRTGPSLGAVEFVTSANAPSISTQPTNQNLQVGQQIIDNVVATGTAPLFYQWYFGSTPVIGATTAVLSIPNAQLANSGSYDVIVSNSVGTATSSTVTITVTNPTVPLIAVSTTNLNFNVVPTNTVTQLAFIVSNKGTSTLNGTASVSAPYSFVSSATYSLPTNGSQTMIVAYTPTANEQDNQTITLTGAGGTNVYCTGIAVTLQNPTNLTEAGATLISGTNTAFSLSSGFLLQSSTTFQSAYSGGQAYLGFTLPNQVTNANLFGSVEATNSPNNNQAYVAIDQVPLDPTCIWDMTNIASGVRLLPVSWRGTGAFNTNSGLFQPQFPTNAWNLGAGFHYVQIAGRTLNTRIGTLQVLQLLPAVNTPPLVVVQPVSQTVVAGTPVTFTVQATGTLPLSYQWQYQGQPIAGANQTSYSIAYPLPVNNGQYSALVTNIAGSVVSFAATLTVTNNPNVPSHVKVHLHGHH